jgi:hypothetical protein
MKANTGSTDRIIRIVLAIIIGYYAYSTSFEVAWIQIVLYVVAAILLITTFIKFCPLYAIFGINTCKIDK